MSANIFELGGEAAVVTGGATGIGAAAALALARGGARVLVTTHNRPADELLARASGEGLAIDAIACELAGLSEEDAGALLDAAEALVGPVSVLVNNAGIIRRADATSYSHADWQRVMALNLDAVWTLSQAAGRRMVARRRGRIVNIASLLSFQGGVRVPAYAAAKHAVAGLTKALANEWGADGVTVNAVAPGYIDTDAIAPLKADPVRREQILARIPADRWGRPEDVAGAVAFLAGPAAAYVNGHVLVVDGGWMGR